MTPKKSLIEKFVADGANVPVDKRVSAAFLLMNMSMVYMEEAEEILKQYGLTVGEAKRNVSLTHKYFERFASGIRTLINHGTKEQKMNLFMDVEELEKMITAYINQDQKQEEEVS